ncbi:MAG: M23 family metallopeptidase [Eubacterium sp.]
MKKILSLFMSLVMLLSIIAGLNLTANAGVKLYWPVPGHTNLSQGFHDGNAIDISDGTITGAKVIAAIGGTVTHKFTCTSQHYGSFGDCNGFGTGLVIKGTDGRVYQYAHMQGGSIPSGINVGSSVSSGQQIGKVGTTGNSSGAHLHFAITYTNYWDNSGINPANESYDYTDPSASLEFSIKNTTNISTNSATVNFSISNPSNKTVSKVGMKIRKSSETNWSKTYEETLPSSIYNSSTFNTTYVIGSGKEVNYALSAGTEYTWVAYAVVGSKTYTSGNNKFTTKGSATPLTFSIKNTTNISTNSATVNFSISNPSNKTVSKVGMKIRKSSETNWSKTYEETLPSSIYNSSTFNTTYVIGSGKEVNYALSAGTEYTWVAYAVIGTTTYYSSNSKFQTSQPKCASGHIGGTPTVTKATLNKNGSVVTKCSVCGAVINSKLIYSPNNFKLSTSSYTYDGKIKKPSITVYDNDGGIIEKENYTVSYASGRKSVGKYAVTVKFKGNYSGEKTVYFTIKPKSTSLSSVKAGSKKLTVKWKKQTSQTTGYQIQYSTSSKFTSPKTVTVSKNSTTSSTISKLKSKKKYYVRVRTYKNVKVNGKTTKIYSSWSKSKSIKTK